MSHYKEQAIMVTGYSVIELVSDAHKKASELFGDLVTPLLPGVINGAMSFAVMPTGSKANCDISENHEKSCKDFINFLKTECAFEDGEPRLSWVEVVYGNEEDDGAATILDDSYCDANEYDIIV